MNELATTNLEMNGNMIAEPKRVFFVGGEKGGVGKTWFSSLMIELLLKDHKSPTIIDMDRTTPNIAKAYLKDIYKKWMANADKKDGDIFSAVKSSDSSRGKKKKTRLEELLMEQITLSDDPALIHLGDNLLEIVDLSQDVVVSMPSQSQKGFCYWLNENDLGTGDNSPPITLWWVSDGSYESIQLLENFMPQYPGLRYCLVVNKGIRNVTNWENYRLEKVSPELTSKIEEGKLKAISIENLAISPELLMLIQQQGLTFGELLSDPNSNRFFVRRLNKWMEDCFAAIGSTGYC